MIKRLFKETICESEEGFIGIFEFVIIFLLLRDNELCIEEFEIYCVQCIFEEEEGIKTKELER